MRLVPPPVVLPEAMHRPHVIAEWNLAIAIDKPRMVVLFPWNYETQFGNAKRYVDYPPGWNSNVKLSKVSGGRLSEDRHDFSTPANSVRDFLGASREVMERLVTWRKPPPKCRFGIRLSLG